MSLNVPEDILERVRGARTEVVDEATFVKICRTSLPGAVKMYEQLRDRLVHEPTGAVRLCFHGFTDREQGHVIRACYGDAINQAMNKAFGLILVRASTGRVIGFTPDAAARPDFRARVFALSDQQAHGDDTVSAPAIVDGERTLDAIRALYPRAFERIARHKGQPFVDLERKDAETFRENVAMLSTRPYRWLLEDAFGPLVTINCCGDLGQGKEDPKKRDRSKDAPPKGPTTDTMGAIDWGFVRSRTFQIQNQEPALLDC